MEEKTMRLSQVAKILNKGLSSVASSLSAKGFKVEVNPNTKINMEQLEVLAKEYKSTELLNKARRAEPRFVVAEPPRRQEEDVVLYRRDDASHSIVKNKPESAPAELPKKVPIESRPILQTAQSGLPGLKSVGKIDLNERPVIKVVSIAKPSEVNPPDLSSPPAPEVVSGSVANSAKLKYEIESNVRVSILPAANRIPISVNKNDTLETAKTLMMLHDYSQLPVISGERHVNGWISWKSIAERLLDGETSKSVQDYIDKDKKVLKLEDTTSLFDVTKAILEEEIILIHRNNNTICGLVTMTDIIERYALMTEPFLILGEIENHIRKLLHGHFSLEELKNFRNPDDKKRNIQSISDLTFGEYLEIFKKPNEWKKLNIAIEKTVFVENLDKVKSIRNKVMHFKPEGLEAIDQETLRKTLKFFSKLSRLKNKTSA